MHIELLNGELLIICKINIMKVMNSNLGDIYIEKKNIIYTGLVLSIMHNAR